MINPVERLSDDGLALFLYHGVVRENKCEIRNYTGKHRILDDFHANIKGLSEAGVALTLDEVLEHCWTNTPFPAKSYAITFDDGFENNYSVAAPVLDEFKIPACFYITTGFVQDNAMSWIDRIEFLIEKLNQTSVRLPWETEARYLEGRASKISLLAEVRRHVKSEASFKVNDFISELYNQAGVDEVFASNHPLDLKMSWQQVREISTHERFTVGGHTHTHAIMSFLNAEELLFEVDTSLDLLSKNAGVGSRHYSYPEGLRHCYNQEVIDLLKARGVECSPSAEDGLVKPGDDPFHFSRILVG